MLVDFLIDNSVFLTVKETGATNDNFWKISVRKTI